MALTRVQGATAHIDAVTQFQLDPADSPGVYVGIVNLTNIAGCVVHMKWVNQLVSDLDLGVESGAPDGDVPWEIWRL
jgi:hypothetical protein